MKTRTCGEAAKAAEDGKCEQANDEVERTIAEWQAG